MASRRAMAAEPEGPEENREELAQAPGLVVGGNVPAVRLQPLPLRFEAKPVTPLRQGETYQQRLDAFGLDEVLTLITGGSYLIQVAEAADVPPGSLLQWTAKDEARQRAVDEARRLTARLWDEQAVQAVQGASSWFQLEQGKQLAQHYRWRAAKVDVQGYGEKQTVDLTHKLPPIEDVDARLRELASFWSAMPATQPAMLLPRLDDGVVDVEDISGLDEVLR